jgi:hypothetical protein
MIAYIGRAELFGQFHMACRTGIEEGRDTVVREIREKKRHCGKGK